MLIQTHIRDRGCWLTMLLDVLIVENNLRVREHCKARLNNSDVPFYRVEYMFYHTSSMEGDILHFVLAALRLLAFIKHDRKT